MSNNGSCFVGISESRIVVAAVAAIVVFCWTGLTFAQVLGPNPTIAGMPVQCGGAVAVVQVIPDIAMARPGYILLNPNFFNLPGKLQLFIYAHECGHHVQGANEAGADCWAIQTGRRQGWFDREDIVYIQQYFGSSPGDWTHAPGPMRVGKIMACFEAAGGSDSGAGDGSGGGEDCEERCDRRQASCEQKCDKLSEPDECLARCDSRYDACVDHCE